MYIRQVFTQKPHTIQRQLQPSKSTPTQENQTELPRLCANQIYFGAGFMTAQERILKNFKTIEQNFNTTFKPAKNSYISTFNDEMFKFFNKFYNQECENITVKSGKNPEFIIEGLEVDDTNYLIKMSKTNQNGEDFLKIEYSDSKNPLNTILVNPKKTIRENISKSSNLFDEGGEKIIEIFSKFNDFVNSHIFNNLEDYFVMTVKNSENLIKSLDERLKSLERSKMFTLKSSYPGTLAFARKTTFHLKDKQNIPEYSYALFRHKKENDDFLRLVKMNSQGGIEDAYLLNSKRQAIRNYCPSRKFRWSTLKYTPLDLSPMNGDELANSKAVQTITKYFNLLSEFGEYVEKNIDKSVKTIKENSKSIDKIAVMSIKHTFTDNIGEIMKNDRFTLQTPDGINYILTRSKENNFDVITLISEDKNRSTSIKLNAENSKLFMTNSQGEIVYNLKGEAEYMSAKSSIFDFKTSVMKKFIREALKLKNVDMNETWRSDMLDLKETYLHADDIWKRLSITKKTAAIKNIPTYVQTRGSMSELRFKIPDKDYILGLKPQQTDSFEFVRLSIYDKGGKIKQAYLINDFYKIVDNYCTKGCTKDSLVNIPKNILYKTEAQINSENIPQLVKEYTKELKNFTKTAEGFTIDKRVKTSG